MKQEESLTNILIFDVDGVLLDDTNSYYEAIKQTFLLYIFHKFHQKVNPQWIDNQLIRSLKKKGGLNDDHDVTAVLLVYYVSLLNCHGVQEKKWDIVSFLKSFSKEGIAGFLQATKEKNRDTLDFLEKDSCFQKKFKNNILIQIFQEIYMGSDFYKKKYQNPPFFYKGKGTLHNEVPLIQNFSFQKLETLFDAFAIATGRDDWTTRYAIKEHFSEVNFEYMVTSSDLSEKEKKPNPKSLLNIDSYFSKREKKGSLRYFYIGDQKDDMNMVFSAQKDIDVIPIAFYRKMGTFSREDFLDMGVEHVVSNHLELEWVLKKENSKEKQL